MSPSLCPPRSSSLFSLPGPIPTAVLEFGGISVSPQSTIKQQGRFSCRAWRKMFSNSFSDWTCKAILGWWFSRYCWARWGNFCWQFKKDFKTS